MSIGNLLIKATMRELLLTVCTVDARMISVTKFSLNDIFSPYFGLNGLQASQLRGILEGGQPIIGTLSRYLSFIRTQLT